MWCCHLQIPAALPSASAAFDWEAHGIPASLLFDDAVPAAERKDAEAAVPRRAALPGEADDVGAPARPPVPRNPVLSTMDTGPMDETDVTWFETKIGQLDTVLSTIDPGAQDPRHDALTQNLLRYVQQFRTRVEATITAAAGGDADGGANMTLMQRVLQAQEDADRSIGTYRSIVAVALSGGAAL